LNEESQSNGEALGYLHNIALASKNSNKSARGKGTIWTRHFSSPLHNSMRYIPATKAHLKVKILP